MTKDNRLDKDKKLVVDDNENFLFVEAFKTLRTNLSFSLAARENHRLAVTSSLESEGKSVVSLNLSYVLSQTGKKVCLIDADMRSPKVHKYLGVKNGPGLSGILSGQESVENCIVKTPYENLFVIRAGLIPPNPAELLNSKFTDPFLKLLDEMFDYVVIDTPPINVVSDALVIASHNTGLLFVVRENASLHEEFKKSLRSIEMSNIDLIGVVINDAAVENKSGGYYKKGRYGGKYNYRYGSTPLHGNVDDSFSEAEKKTGKRSGAK